MDVCMIFQLIFLWTDVGAIQDIHEYLIHKNNVKKCLGLFTICLLEYLLAYLVPITIRNVYP